MLDLIFSVLNMTQVCFIPSQKKMAKMLIIKSYIAKRFPYTVSDNLSLLLVTKYHLMTILL